MFKIFLNKIFMFVFIFTFFNNLSFLSCTVVSDLIKQNLAGTPALDLKIDPMIKIKFEQEYPAILEKVGYENAISFFDILYKVNFPQIFSNILWQVLETTEPTLKKNLFFSFRSKLKWCAGCPSAPTNKRIELAFRLMEDTLYKYPNPNEKLTYTSLASGELLQDFVNLIGLIMLGYNNFHLNFIDSVYEDTHYNVESFINSFNLLVNYFVSYYKKNFNPTYNLSNLSFKTYSSAHELIQEVANDASKKSNILVCIDVGFPTTKSTNDPQKINYISLKINSKDNSTVSEFYIHATETGPCSFWARNESPELTQAFREILNTKINEISDFLGSKEYKVKLINKLREIDTFSFKNEKYSIEYRYSECIYDIWKKLIDKSAIDGLNRRVIFQLTSGEIFPFFVDDEHESFNEIYGH